MGFESLINFLFDNIVFLIFVIGGILSFLKRMSEENENSKNNKKKAKVPRFGSTVEQPNTTATYPHKHDAKVNQIEEIENVKNQQKLEKNDEPLAKNDNVASDASITAIPLSRKKKIRKQQLLIPKSKVVEGVIWSEILGKPKAKQNYFNRNK